MTTRSRKNPFPREWRSDLAQPEDNDNDSVGPIFESQHVTEDVQEAILAKRYTARMRQILIGKARPEYRRFLQKVPYDDRTEDHPNTPNAKSKISKREFDRELSAWRRLLHAWDGNPNPKYPENQGTGGNGRSSRKKQPVTSVTSVPDPVKLSLHAQLFPDLLAFGNPSEPRPWLGVLRKPVLSDWHMDFRSPFTTEGNDGFSPVRHELRKVANSPDEPATLLRKICGKHPVTPQTQLTKSISTPSSAPAYLCSEAFGNPDNRKSSSSSAISPSTPPTKVRSPSPASALASFGKRQSPRAYDPYLPGSRMMLWDATPSPEQPLPPWNIDSSLQSVPPMLPVALFPSLMVPATTGQPSASWSSSLQQQLWDQ